MSCVQLNNGLNNCVKSPLKYYQRAVLINMNDFDKHVITITDTKHDLRFNLKVGKKGYTLSSPEKGGVILGEFSKSSVFGLSQYTHTVLLPIVRNDGESKRFLSKLDDGSFVIALLDYDNNVEIFGWDFGMNTADGYTFAITDGGVIVEMKSEDEREIPYNYVSLRNAKTDFDNEFQNIPDPRKGDFNDDFNDDFNVGL